ncbi:hypothetical protein ES703_111224 [subsurface metagenome]
MESLAISELSFSRRAASFGNSSRFTISGVMPAGNPSLQVYSAYSSRWSVIIFSVISISIRGVSAKR